VMATDFTTPRCPRDAISGLRSIFKRPCACNDLTLFA
jgi:hypothetical protein